MTGAPRGDYRRFRTSKDTTFAQHAIAVHICRGCGLWHSGTKPPACTACGRMDYESFQSTGEAKTWAKLMLRQERGEIAELQRQYKIPLLTVHHRTGKPVAWANYFADFRWLDTETGERVIAECKPGGSMTYESQLKIRCVEAMGLRIEMLT